MTELDGHHHAPGGLYATQNHHQLGEGESAHLDDRGRLLKRRRDGGSTALDPSSKDAPKPPSPGPGWVSFASWAPGGTVSHLSGRWTVPQPPAQNRREIVFLHIGLKGHSGGQVVFAPVVLQWGKTPYGGGAYWSVACWLQVGSHIMVGNYVEVAPGDTVEAQITHRETAGHRVITMRGQGADTSTLTFSLAQPLENQLAYGGVLEAYALNMQCDQYPAARSIDFTDLTVEGPDGALDPAWEANNEVLVCGQQTQVVDPKHVRVYFHGPSSATE